jgi:hypothetical protein
MEEKTTNTCINNILKIYTESNNLRECKELFGEIYIPEKLQLIIRQYYQDIDNGVDHAIMYMFDTVRSRYYIEIYEINLIFNKIKKLFYIVSDSNKEFIKSRQMVKYLNMCMDINFNTYSVFIISRDFENDNFSVTKSLKCKMTNNNKVIRISSNILNIMYFNFTQHIYPQHTKYHQIE